MTARKIPPRDLALGGAMFLDGAKGMFEQVYKNDEYGVTVHKGRASRDDPVQVTIRIEGSPDEWSSYDEMVEALREQGWTE